MEDPFVSPRAHVVDSELGAGVKVWHFCNLYGCRVGAGTQVGSFCEIRNGASVGANCRLQSNVIVGEECVVEDHVFIGPFVVFTNDRTPSARKALDGSWKLEPVVVREHSVIGAGTVVLGGVRIGPRAVVGAGSLVTTHVEPFAVVRGNPAHVVGDLREPPWSERWRELLD